MTTPTFTVEIAFNAGYSTPAASRTWTDVSAYVSADDLSVQFGRTDEFSTAGPNTLSLGFDNSDGRFTPERSSSPYYPNVKLFRPIRVTATLPDASTSVRFLGYVTQWPTQWPDGDSTAAESSLTASSRLARLGATTQLRSMVEQEILVNNPVRYYTLGDGEGSTSAADSTGGTNPSLTPIGSVTFGQATGPAGDDLTAVTIGTGGYLLDNSGSPFFPQSLICFFLAASNVTIPLVKTTGQNPTTLVELVAGKVRALDGAITSASTYGDGQWHMVAISRGDGPGWSATLYVDKDPVGTASVTPLTTSNLRIGDAGVEMAHVALFDSFVGTLALTFAFWAADGFHMTTTPDALIGRLAAYAGIDASEIDPDPSDVDVKTTMQGISGKTILDAMRDVEATEAGVLYDDRNGDLKMAARTARYGVTSAFSLNADTQVVATDFAPNYDLSGLVNDVSATGPTTTARYINQASIDDNGYATASITTSAIDEGDPLQQAAWLVNNYGQPHSRLGTLTVDLLSSSIDSSLATSIASATVGTLITVTNMPSQAAASSGSFFVEGYTEKLTTDSWTITFNVSPSAPYLSTWVLGSGTRSQLDSMTLAL